ncbi:inositol-pentakisphosphate 2-kinase [Teleopsis dalmanni]|uniref:inositol-pentakisphosphate 2-kinase n=1 Tax=Teleopsis dalmanni TaxID=139649 RepID=UPI0018CDC486|nr:inositol-pentakisphosphate 2-kinase [Teleopsis dalmanni]
MPSDSTYSKVAGHLLTSSTPRTLNECLAISEHMELCQIELHYRAEGNANLVLALPQFKKVLRLPKMLPMNGQTQQQFHVKKSLQQKRQQQQTLESVSDLVRQQNTKVENLTMKEFVDFIEIIRRLLGNEFIFEAEVIQIPKEADRKWINEHVRAARPAHRLDKEFCGQFGLLLPDVTQLPAAFDILVSNLQPRAALTGDTYAIEIKPKQGWLLPSDVNNLFKTKVASSERAKEAEVSATITASHKASVRAAEISQTTSETTKISNANDTRCRYCAMQFLKLQQQKVSERSSYCPMELFSGAPGKMLAALDALFECPQNNLRIFQNGNLIYGDHYKSLSFEKQIEQIFTGKMTLAALKDFIVTCLLRDSDENGKVAKSRANIVVPGGVGQPHSSATQTQAATSNALMIETKAETEVQATSTQITEAEMLCLPKNCILQKILHLQLLAKRNLKYMYENGFLEVTTKSYTALGTLLKKQHVVNFLNLRPEEEYLLAAMAMDCSIMLTFQEIEGHVSMDLVPFSSTLSQHIVQIPNSNKTFLTKMHILDLDPKPDSHFSKYVKQTRMAYECSEKR